MGRGQAGSRKLRICRCEGRCGEEWNGMGMFWPAGRVLKFAVRVVWRDFCFGMFLSAVVLRAVRL